MVVEPQSESSYDGPVSPKISGTLLATGAHRPAQAGVRRTRVLAVDVGLGDELVERVLRLVREPVREVVRPADARDRDRALEAGLPHHGHGLLHAGRLVRDVVVERDGAAALEEAILLDDRLAPRRKHHVLVVLEGLREARPEGRRVIRVRSGRLVRRLRRAGRPPHQRELRVHVVAVEQVHVLDDRAPVARAAVLRLHAVDAEPALLVQRDPDGVDVPLRDRPDGCRAVRPVEDAPALDARVLGAGAVDSAEVDEAPLRVEELVAGHVKAAPGRGRAGRRSRSGARR